MYDLDFDTRLLIKVAKEEGIPFIQLDNDLVQLGYGKGSRLMKGLLTEKRSYLGVSLSEIKKRRLLLNNGLPVVDASEDLSGRFYRILVIGDEVASIIESDDFNNQSDLSQSRILDDKLNFSINRLAIKAVELLRLDVAEVDISAPSKMGDGKIIRVNSLPSLRCYYRLDSFKAESIAKRVIDLIAPHSIPIISIIGDNQNRIITYLLVNIFKEAGLEVGAATCKEIYINNELRTFFGGDVSSKEVVLMDKKVEIAIIETGQNSKSDDNKGDIGVFVGEIKTNNIISRIKREGYVILEADSKEAINLISNINVDNIIPCSLVSDNLFVKKIIKEGKEVIYIKSKNLVLFDGEDELPIIRIDNIKELFSDKEVVDLLLATATGYAYGIPVFIIRSAIKKIIKNIKRNNSVIKSII